MQVAYYSHLHFFYFNIKLTTMTTKQFFIIAILGITLTAVTMQSCSKSRGNSETTTAGALHIPELIDRPVSKGAETEYEELHTRFDNAVLALAKNPDDIKQYITIASVYISESRISGNTNYYNDAALRILNYVIDRSSGNSENLYLAMSMKSGVLMSLHQFSKAWETANNALALNNHNSTIYGALTDANVELGKYAEAVSMCDAMLSLKPDIRSYARASYIRQIYGDNAGAIDAMKMAVAAGVPGMENTEWARVVLGDLYAMTGDLQQAQNTYDISLQYRADYDPAIAGKAHVAILKNDYATAITLLKQAIAIKSEVQYVRMLADAYMLSADVKKADEIHNDVLQLLLDGEKEQKNMIVPHNSARELAMAYLSVNDLDNAQKYAEKDLEMRPENIDANELMAWISYKQGNTAKATEHIAKAMATGVKNNNYLYKASLIYTAAGDTAKAESYYAAAKSISPYFDKTIQM